VVRFIQFAKVDACSVDHPMLGPLVPGFLLLGLLLHATTSVYIKLSVIVCADVE
jgi:hypothetical protein